MKGIFPRPSYSTQSPMHTSGNFSCTQLFTLLYEQYRQLNMHSTALSSSPQLSRRPDTYSSAVSRTQPQKPTNRHQQSAKVTLNSVSRPTPKYSDKIFQGLTLFSRCVNTLYSMNLTRIDTEDLSSNKCKRFSYLLSTLPKTQLSDIKNEKSCSLRVQTHSLLKEALQTRLAENTYQYTLHHERDCAALRTYLASLTASDFSAWHRQALPFALVKCKSRRLYNEILPHIQSFHQRLCTPASTILPILPLPAQSSVSIPSPMDTDGFITVTRKRQRAQNRSSSESSASNHQVPPLQSSHTPEVPPAKKTFITTVSSTSDIISSASEVYTLAALPSQTFIPTLTLTLNDNSPSTWCSLPDSPHSLDFQKDEDIVNFHATLQHATDSFPEDKVLLTVNLSSTQTPPQSHIHLNTCPSLWTEESSLPLPNRYCPVEFYGSTSSDLTKLPWDSLLAWSERTKSPLYLTLPSIEGLDAVLSTLSHGTQAHVQDQLITPIYPFRLFRGLQETT